MIADLQRVKESLRIERSQHEPSSTGLPLNRSQHQLGGNQRASPTTNHSPRSSASPGSTHRPAPYHVPQSSQRSWSNDVITNPLQIVVPSCELKEEDQGSLEMKECRVVDRVMQPDSSSLELPLNLSSRPRDEQLYEHAISAEQHSFRYEASPKVLNDYRASHASVLSSVHGQSMEEKNGVASSQFVPHSTLSLYGTKYQMPSMYCEVAVSHRSPLNSRDVGRLEQCYERQRSGFDHELRASGHDSCVGTDTSSPFETYGSISSRPVERVMPYHVYSSRPDVELHYGRTSDIQFTSSDFKHSDPDSSASEVIICILKTWNSNFIILC